MALPAGTRLGPYEILSPAGAGGMGEVYRARDTRLDRTVAIKVLPTHLAANPDLKQRFEREARAVSSLSHPNICTLHDIGHQSGVDFLVLEYLEGETLDRRLTKGPVPLEELLRCAVQMADALEKAHRQGIIHRDLKPANIMLTKSGTKLLDFGLAKLKDEPVPVAAALTEMTAEARKLTQEGTILGTFQYMAPEQLEGAEADARTDIFAFGAVLYEMATGRAAFAGRTKASLIAAILSADPKPASTLAPTTPPALDRLVKTCLAKDPDERFQTAHDVKLQLQWIAEAGSQAGVAAPVAARRKNRERLAWVTAGVLLLLAALFGTGFFLRAPKPAPVVRSSINLPPQTRLFYDAPFALSPDGRRLAFVASGPDAKFMLWVRPLDSLTVQALAGTEGAQYPFWSPDSRFVGFFADGKLKKIDVSGGPAQTICDAEDGRGGAWSRDGVILFAPGPFTAIDRVSASGGTPTPVTTPENLGTSHRWPSFLPDGRHFLFFSGASGPKDGIYVAALDSKEVSLVAKEETSGIYVEPGYLLFLREASLMAQPFDLGRHRVNGDAVPVAEHVHYIAVRWNGSFTVSSNGFLLYQGGGSTENKAQLTWFDRTGKQLGTLGEPAALADIRLSPDGSKVLADRPGAQGSLNLWMYDAARGIASRFTFSTSVDESAVWSPDGKQVVFTSNRQGNFSLYLKPSSGTGGEQVLLAGEGDKFATDWSPDGRFIVYNYHGPTSKKRDLWILPLTGDRKPYPFLATEADEAEAAFSPDGRWLAYLSDESGREELYVVPFPGSGGKWQISSSGAFTPAWWNPDGKELTYVSADLKMTSVDVNGKGSEFAVGATRTLLGDRPLTNVRGGSWSRDGQRILLTVLPEDTAAPLTLVQNWAADLRR